VTSVDDFDCVVLGGALYMGRWHANARRLVRRHALELTVVPVALFALGPRTLAPADVAASRAQLDRELARLPDIAPSLVTIFGGAVDPAKLRWPFSRMPASDARDWQAIDAWADAVAALGREAGDTSKRANLVREVRNVADAGLALSRSRG
jgi:menaquinone-dependent protoporphyrinogen oxidase